MTKNNVTTTTSNALSTDVMELFSENAGLGMETLTSDDMILAQLKIAQSTSPQLKPRDPKYIAGLQIGDLFNSATGAVYGPSAKIAVLGVYKAMIIWGTLDDTSKLPPEDTVWQCIDPKRYAQIEAEAQRVDTKLVWKGTKRVNTSLRIAAVVFREDGTYDPVMIDCVKTKYKNAKQLNTLLDSIRFKGSDGRTHRVPACASLINIEVIENQNDMNTWYEFKFSRIMEDNLLSSGLFKADILKALIEEAKLLKENLVSGIVKMDEDTEAEASDSASTVADEVRQAEIEESIDTVFGKLD